MMSGRIRSEMQMSAPGFYKTERENIQRVMRELEQVQQQMDVAFNRWSELEAAKSPED
jgi:hypothetical protein